MAVVRSPDFLRVLNQRDCACNIDPPASSYAIMRRVRPYRGENNGPGKDIHGELDPTPGIREQAGPSAMSAECPVCPKADAAGRFYEYAFWAKIGMIRGDCRPESELHRRQLGRPRAGMDRRAGGGIARGAARLVAVRSRRRGV